MISIRKGLRFRFSHSSKEDVTLNGMKDTLQHGTFYTIRDYSPYGTFHRFRFEEISYMDGPDRYYWWTTWTDRGSFFEGYENGVNEDCRLYLNSFVLPAKRFIL